jgi:hypothetical protein
MEEIINAMHKKEISGALLDMYAAATKKDSFDGGDIQLNRLIEYPTGYGFVLSGDMAKAAPLFRDALDSQKNKISEIVEGNTESIQLVSFKIISSFSTNTVFISYYVFDSILIVIFMNVFTGQKRGRRSERKIFRFIRSGF